MKDIDFDELDKAVNSLMSSVTSEAETPKREPVDPTPVAYVTPEPASKPIDPPRAEPVPATPVETKPAEPLKRSSGRFMDVVHPSSDMRTPSPSLAKAPSRSGVSIAPPSRPVSDMTVTPATKPFVTPEVKKEEPATPVEERPDASFPDPLDLMTSSDEPEVKNDVVEQAPEEDLVIPEPTVTEEQGPKDDSPIADPTEPLESLFLPNVKVEKRPLGAASGLEESLNEAETPEASEDEQKADSLVIPDPELAELRDDVLAIESDASTPTELAGSADTEEHTDTPALGTAESFASSAISSIPRQYNVKPSTDDKHHEALYDTAAQTGAPLSHPAKKRSGWLVVLWIVMLIVVAVGGAMALYFLKVF